MNAKENPSTPYFYLKVEADRLTLRPFCNKYLATWYRLKDKKDLLEDKWSILRQVVKL